MILITEDKVYDLHYRTNLIKGAINIVDWDWLREFGEFEVTAFGVVSVNELSSCSGVDKRETD